MAVPAKNLSDRRSPPEKQALAVERHREFLAQEAKEKLNGRVEKVKPQPPTDIEAVPRDLVREKAAELYGQGYRRSQIAKILGQHLTPRASGHTVEKQRRNKLRAWEKDPKFRDLVYAKAVADVDLSTPEILQGITARAKDGKVDAARLALEVTGRHNPRGEDHPTQVIVAFGNIPRPSLPQTTEDDEYVDMEED